MKEERKKTAACWALLVAWLLGPNLGLNLGLISGLELGHDLDQEKKGKWALGMGPSQK